MGDKLGVSLVGFFVGPVVGLFDGVEVGDLDETLGEEEGAKEGAELLIVGDLEGVIEGGLHFVSYRSVQLAKAFVLLPQSV